MNEVLKAALDERLKKALEFSEYRITLSNQKKNAKLKLEADLTMGHNGGLFKTDSALISFVAALIHGGKESAVLLDINETPIHIDDLSEFYNSVVEKYHVATNAYLHEVRSINKSRSTASILGNL